VKTIDQLRMWHDRVVQAAVRTTIAKRAYEDAVHEERECNAQLQAVVKQLAAEMPGEAKEKTDG